MVSLWTRLAGSPGPPPDLRPPGFSSSSWKSTLPKVMESLGLSRPAETRLPLMQVPLELPRSLTWTPAVTTVSSACLREMVGS
jgi:hypothetical protein